MNARELKDRVSIPRLLKFYGWKGQSRGWQQGKKTQCPFHPDEHPSAVYDNQRFMCFGCGMRGDIIDLVQSREGLDFKGAMEWIQSRLT